MAKKGILVDVPNLKHFLPVCIVCIYHFFISVFILVKFGFYKLPFFIQKGRKTLEGSPSQVNDSTRRAAKAFCPYSFPEKFQMNGSSGH